MLNNISMLVASEDTIKLAGGCEKIQIRRHYILAGGAIIKDVIFIGFEVGEKCKRLPDVVTPRFRLSTMPEGEGLVYRLNGEPPLLVSFETEKGVSFCWSTTAREQPRKEEYKGKKFEMRLYYSILEFYVWKEKEEAMRAVERLSLFSFEYANSWLAITPLP